MGRLAKWIAAGLLAWAGLATPALAEERDARAELESAAAAMGGLERLQSLETMVLTGFGQRVYQDGGGFITGEPMAPPKWQSITDAQRTFDLQGERALRQERRAYQFPFAGFFGLDFARRGTLERDRDLLNHPLTALLEALDAETQLGAVTMEEGRMVVEFTPEGARSPAWIGIDAQTRLPAFTRWITGSSTLGDITYTAWFTGYTPVDGLQLPIGLMEQMDWRDQVSLMFQVDSYRLDAPQDQLPRTDHRLPPPMPRPLEATITPVAEGLWDLRVGSSGGAVVEFADRLVMFEAYGSEAATLARIDAANRLVEGKRVEAVIVSHHHFDHTGGLRAAISRGLEVISQRGNEQIIREMATRPARYYPDELARNPQELVFTPVDERLVLEDATQRLEIYRVVQHTHMPDAVFAYLPAEQVMLDGDLGDEAWQLHWWGSALAANIAHYGIDPLTEVPVHGSGPIAIAQVLANIQGQVEAAQEYCRETEAGGRYVFGCPVQSDSTGLLPLAPR